MSDVSAIDFSGPSEGDGAHIRLEQLADMADALVEQVTSVRSHYEHLEQMLSAGPPEPAETVGGARPVEATFDIEADGDDEPQVHDSARLVVMEMAMSGSTRDQTKQYLRNALEVEGGDPIVDEVFDRTEAAQGSARLRRRLFTRRRD
jgi:hypothetical protein